MQRRIKSNDTQLTHVSSNCRLWDEGVDKCLICGGGDGEETADQ
jgi:hypothetical protein